jgi:hypothetical protein
MKRILYLILFLSAASAITSCTKKDGASDLPQPVLNTDPFVPVPDRFSKKVLIEELTGAWCGYCPRGPHYLHAIDSMYEEEVIDYAIHVGDVMEVPELVTSSGANMLDSGLFLNTGYPNGCINRGQPLSDPSDWPGAVPSEIGLYAKCGLAIDASILSGNALTVIVHTGFAQALYTSYRLNVFLVEDNVHSAGNSNYDQHNYYSSTGTSPDSSYNYYGGLYPQRYYDLPPVITDYHYSMVLRKLLSAVPYGDVIPESEMTKGHDFKKSYTVNLTGFDKTKCYIVAFVDKYGTELPHHQVQNIQRVKVGQVKMWD